MKKITLTFAFLFAIVALSEAQTSPREGKRVERTRNNANATDSLKKTPEERALMYANKMQSNLQLDDKQKQAVYNLTLQKMQNRAKTLASQKEARKEKMETLRAHRQEEQAAYTTEMKKILTPEQQIKYAEIQDKLKSKIIQRNQLRNENRDKNIM